MSPPETESVVVTELRSLMVSCRLRVIDLSPPPPPPCWPPSLWNTPQPAVPSSVAPARPAPPIFRKSRRDSRFRSSGLLVADNALLSIMTSPLYKLRHPLHAETSTPTPCPQYAGASISDGSVDAAQ